MKNIFLIFIIIGLTGCGTSSTLVLKPIKQNYKTIGITVVATKNHVKVPSEIINELDSKIKLGLYKNNNFKASKDLILEYKFLQQDEGNQLSRWFWGGIGNSGEATLTVEVTYKDKFGNELSKTQVNGRIGSGAFGGSFNEAIEKVAESIVKFTVENFSITNT